MIYIIVSNCGGVFANVIFFIFIIRAVLLIGIEHCTLFAYGNINAFWDKGVDDNFNEYDQYRYDKAKYCDLDSVVPALYLY